MMPLPSSEKRIKKMPIDRFTKLPDSLLIHILSFLGVKKAAITSVLSKRWEFLWAELPRLEFWETSGKREEMLKFVYMVTRTLEVRTVNYLEEFEVKLNSCQHIDSFIDVLLKFPVKNKVKKLSILIEDYGASYHAPRVIYSCSSVRTLRVQGITMPRIIRTTEWKSLTELSVKDAQLDQPFVDEILQNCPVLSICELDGSWGYDNLYVTSPSINRLTVVHTEGGEDEPFLEISAPYVHTLCISLTLWGRKLKARNMSSLVRADINLNGYEVPFPFREEERMNDTKEFLENFQHTQELRVGPQCFKVVSKMAVNGWQLSQSSRKHLTVTSSRVNKQCISGIICLLDSSPYLETLVIEGYNTKGEYSILDPGAKGDLDGDLVRLKTIQVRNFADPNCERILALARILLKRATALEEMVVVTNVEDSIAFGRVVAMMAVHGWQLPRSPLDILKISAAEYVHVFSRNIFR